MQLSDTQSIDTNIQSYMDRHAALGAAVALLQGGEIVYLGGFGKTSVEENGVKVTPSTLFAYGSICKNICAALVMRLVEQNLLELDSPVVHYLPDFHFSNAEYGRRVTMRHLLSHTTGLPMGGKYWGPRDPDSLRRFVYEQIPHYIFLTEPGVVHLYSNTVFCVAGHVAEAVTGKFYDDLVQEYVLDPLCLDRVTFDPVVAMTYSVALPHELDADGELHVLHRMTYNVSGNPSSFGYGSVVDLANLAQMYLNDGTFGDQRFLRASSVAEMQRTQVSRRINASLRPWTDNYLGFGLGFEVGAYRGRRTAGHGGMNLTYNCFFKLFPDDQAGVVVLTNQCDDPLLWELVTSLYDHVLGLSSPESVGFGEPAARVIALDGNQLQRYAGAYLRIETSDLATFVVAADQLVLERQAKSLPLIPIGDDEFYAEVSQMYRLPVVFIRNAHGVITHVLIGGEPYHAIELEVTFQPDLQLWQSFAGLYKDPSNSNRDEMVRVRLQDGTLFLAEGTHEAPLKAASSRAFLSDLGFYEFEDTQLDQVKILKWGKAVRNYPVDRQLYDAKGIVRYLVNVPVLPPCVS